MGKRVGWPLYSGATKRSTISKREGVKRPRREEREGMTPTGVEKE